MVEAILVAVLAALGGGAAAAFISGRFQVPKTRAESKKIAAEAGEVIERRWQAWAEKLEERVRELEIKLIHSQELTSELQSSLEREKTVTRLVIEWALVMRDEIRRLQGKVPDPPAQVQTYLDEGH
jgi:hypothetical protein